MVKRFIVSCVVAIVVSMSVFVLLNDYGITWDEPIHILNADSYIAWIKRPIYTDKEKFFRATDYDVHPPFRKLVAGITHEVLTSTLRIVDNTRGYRISSLLFVVPFVILLTFVAIGRFGYLIGITVPLMFSFLPHVIYLTPLITMDYAIAALWFIAVITAIKGMKNYLWLTVSGILVGLTLLTKLHGFLLFIPLSIIWYVYSRRFVTLAWCITIALAVYYAGWPWLWSSPFLHLSEYFKIQAIHGSVPVLFFGKIYPFAPWWYTPVMFLVTTPVMILILFAIGANWVVRYGKNWDKIMLFNAVYPIVFFSLPGVYRYDWVRLFLPTFPFVCLIAGRGIWSIRKRIAPAVIVILWIITLYISVIRIHPWESSYYNELVGGIGGAYRIGLETEFWGNANIAVLPWMNDHSDRPMCVIPTTRPFFYYEAMGQLDPTVSYKNTKETCDYLVVSMRQGLLASDLFAMRVINTQTPVYSVSVDGVVLVGVYDITKIRDL